MHVPQFYLINETLQHLLPIVNLPFIILNLTVLQIMYTSCFLCRGIKNKICYLWKEYPKGYSFLMPVIKINQLLAKAAILGHPRDLCMSNKENKQP